jgi:hypothetical protein
MIGDGIKDQVIMLPIASEIGLRVINDLVCANRTHHFQVAGAADPSDFPFQG